MNTKERAVFENGIVCAAAWLVRTRGEVTAAREMIDHLVGRDAIRKADEHDREILEPLICASSDQVEHDPQIRLPEPNSVLAGHLGYYREIDGMVRCSWCQHRTKVGEQTPPFGLTCGGCGRLVRVQARGSQS